MTQDTREIARPKAARIPFDIEGNPSGGRHHPLYAQQPAIQLPRINAPRQRVLELMTNGCCGD